jgi:DNA polymerase-3 subunit beta
MDLKISKQALVKLLSHAVPATAPKSPMAMLSHVLIEAKADGTITARGTDLVLAATSSAQCEVTTPGSLALVARTLQDTAKKLPAGDVRLVLTKDASRLEVKAGKSSFKLPFVAGDDFPKLPSSSGSTSRLVLQSNVLAQLIQQTAYARLFGDDRPNIACVHLEANRSGVTAAATDGNRLAAASNAFIENENAWQDVSIGGRCLADIARVASDMTEPVTLTASGGYVHFEWPTVMLSAKTTGEPFVPWRKVSEGALKDAIACTISRAALSDAISRTMVVSDDKTQNVVMTFTAGLIVLTNESTGKGSAREEVECDSTADYVTKFNAQFLIDALAVITDDDVKWSCGDNLTPATISGATDASAFAVVMPMRSEVAK